MCKGVAKARFVLLLFSSFMFWFLVILLACVLNHSRRRFVTAPSTIPSRVDDSCPLGALLPDVLTKKRKQAPRHIDPLSTTTLLLLDCSPPVSFLLCGYRATVCPRAVCPPLHRLYILTYMGALDIHLPNNPHRHAQRRTSPERGLKRRGCPQRQSSDGRLEVLARARLAGAGGAARAGGGGRRHRLLRLVLGLLVRLLCVVKGEKRSRSVSHSARPSAM